MATTVKVAVSAVAAARASGLLDAEGRLRSRAESISAGVRAQLNKGVGGVLDLLRAMAAEMLDLRCEVALLLKGAAGASDRMLVDPLHTLRLAAPAPTPAGPPEISQRPAALSRGRPLGPAAVSSRLVQDEENVRQLQLLQNLDGVELFQGNGQCVMIFPLQAGKLWERAWDEYAVRLAGRAFVREVESRLGDRWLLVGHADARPGLGKLYSTRDPLYRALSYEYSNKGATVGVSRILPEVKGE